MKFIHEKCKKYVALLIACAMIAGFLPMGALASTIPSSGITATHDLSSSSITIDEPGTYVINQSGSGTTSNTITINANATVYLNGINILVPRPVSNQDLSKPNPFNVLSGYTVNLHLVDGTTNTLASQEGITNPGGTRVGSSKAGLRVPSGATLNIYGYSGILNTTGAQGFNFGESNAHGGGGAGIGGNGGYCDPTQGLNYIDAEFSGRVNIFGGYINAAGGPAAGYWGSGGPGIGGGGASYLGSDGLSGNVSISGGFVTVTGGDRSSQRRSGYGLAGNLTIAGGKLKAMSANTTTDSNIRSPLAEQPVLPSNYQWRTSSVDNFSSSPGESYAYSDSQRYVEIHASFFIGYTLNGGSVAAANPVEYTRESDTFTLHNPTRTGFSFIGWSGTDLVGNTNQTVTIDKGSTGDRSYTANWKADAPAAPAASIVTAKTFSTLTITTQAGHEYSLNGTDWYSGTDGSLAFTGLTAGTQYNLVGRVAAVDSGDLSAASDSSPALSVRTKYAPALSLSVPPENATFPANVELVATITGADDPAGKQIQFYDGEVFLRSVSTDANGKATYVLDRPDPKLYNFRAEFEGNDHNMPASANKEFTVLKGTQAAVSFTNKDDIQKTYGDSSFALPTVSGGTGMGAISYRSSDVKVVTVFGNFVTITGAGEATVFAKRLADADYNESNEDSIRILVDKKDVTITGMGAYNKEFDAQTAAVIDRSYVSMVGVKFGDSVAINYSDATASFSDANAGTGKTVTFKKFALSGYHSDNYRLASQPANTTANITPRQVTVTPRSNQFKYFGQADPTLTCSAEGAVADEIPGYSGSLARTMGEAIASDYRIGKGTLALSDNGAFLAQNYELVLNATPVNFEIRSYSTAAMAATTPNGENGWFNAVPVILNAPAGYQISTSDALVDNTWTNSITLDGAEGNSKSTTYYLKNIETDPDIFTGAISTSKTFDYKVDTTDPVITGIADGATYYVDQVVTVIDTNLDAITVNDDPFENGDKLAGSRTATYVVAAADKAGNSTTFTVAMKPIASLSAEIDLLNVDNVKPGDRAAIETVAAKVEAVLLTTGNGASQAQIDELMVISDKCDDLLETLDQVAELEELITALPKPDEVKKADAEVIARAMDTYESLTDHQKGLVDVALKTKLAEVISALRKDLLFDASTGTRIEAMDGTVLNVKTMLVVKSVMDTLDASTMQKFNLGISSAANGKEIIQLYDIKLLLDGRIIQPNGKVRVIITLTAEQASRTNLQIAYIDENGTAVIIPSTINGNEISFVIDHFSHYAIIGTPIPKAAPVTQTGETRSFFPLIGLALLTAALLLTHKKKRNMRATSSKRN